MDTDERQAIATCQAGDLTGFTLIYERYLDKIYRFVYFKTWHRQTAEDLTAKSFLKALEHVAEYDVARGSFSSWLYRLAHNTVIDYYRTAKVEAKIDDVLNLASKQDIAQETELKRQLEAVAAYLKTLSPATRDLLLMRLWQGLSYQEIAEITGKSEGALKMAAARALKQLRLSLLQAVLAFILLNLN